MFFPERIKKIGQFDRVLEIGPGSQPHSRADVYLEKNFKDDEAFTQAGYCVRPKSIESKTVYYEKLPFPFSDKEFDYVICSHVIEHIPYEDLSTFINELQRITKKGYIEFPNVFYELINFQPVHLWLMNYRNEELLFLDKNIFKSNYMHLAFRELFYFRDNYLYKSFWKYKEFFFIGFEWQDVLNYKIVDNFDLLFNADDLTKTKLYFENLNLPSSIKKSSDSKLKISIMIKRYLKTILPNSLILKLKELKKTNKLPNNISPTAIIENKELVQISKTAEIKDFVIIRTFENSVVIGEFTQINPFSVLYGGSGIYISNNVMIGPNCVLAAGNHDYSQTTIPMRFAGTISKGPIIIEEDVWIGANCTITDGVVIKKGAVIGANSLICKDVSPYSIVGGVPAKMIRSRLGKTHPGNKV